jgi:plastocyanin
MPGRIFLIIAALCRLSSVPAHAAEIEITIDKLAYTPAVVSARVGDIITWINKDPLAHTATATNNDWDVMIAPNQTARLVLKKPGEVDYYCRFHPNMKGRVVVGN